MIWRKFTNMCDEYIKKFYDEVCNTQEGDYKIILEPNRKFTYEWIEYDSVKWEMEKPIQNLVNKLINDKSLNFEEKVYRQILI